MTVNIIYGSDAGATKNVATRIAKKVDGRAISIAEAATADFEDCELLILGIPTYGEGELQSDWEDHIGKLKAANIATKKVALFGTGDQENYPETFVNAMGTLYDHVVAQGAIVVGFTDTDGYSYTRSAAERDGRFVGLALDEDGQASQTGKRIAAWIALLT